MLEHGCGGIVCNNKFVHGNGMGVVMRPGAGGEVESNDIARNYGDAVRQDGAGSTVFRWNTVDHSTQPSFQGKWPPIESGVGCRGLQVAAHGMAFKTKKGRRRTVMVSEGDALIMNKSDSSVQTKLHIPNVWDGV